MLRVPCIPSVRFCGFWRSSVRRLGPLPLRRIQLVRKSPPRCGVSLATAGLGREQLLPESIGLRVARLNARVRLDSSVAIHGAEPLARLRCRRALP